MKLMLAAVAAMGAAPAAAATFVQTVHVDNVFAGQIAAFDQALGTLERVTVSAVVRDTRGASIWSVDPAYSGDFRLAVSGAAGSSLTGLIGYAGDSGAVALSNLSPDIAVTGTGSWSGSYAGAELARFLSAPITVAIDQASAPAITLAAPEDFSGIISDGYCYGCIAIDHVVTYEYAETASLRSLAAPNVVPEPGSWALMIVGFGLVGTMIRRVRAAQKSLV